MSRFGVDEDWGRLSPAQLLAAGKTFVVGYVSEDTTGKNITAGEVQAYLQAGVAVLLVYEYSTTAIAGGAAKGARDAGVALAGARALGYPRGCAIAFAVDQDTSSNPSAVDGYCRAFTAAVRAAGYRSMVYGGFSTVQRCLDLGLTDLGWQTYAWSGGRWDSRAAIRQVSNGVTIAGRAVDLDTAMVDDIGAWEKTMGDSERVFNADANAWAVRTGDNSAVYPNGQPGSTIAPGNPLWDLLRELKTAVAGLAAPAPAVLTDAQAAAIAQQVAAAIAPLVSTPAAATVDELARRLSNG